MIVQADGGGDSGTRIKHTAVGFGSYGRQYMAMAVVVWLGGPCITKTMKSPQRHGLASIRL
jgi:hypothetical protein